MVVRYSPQNFDLTCGCQCFVSLSRGAMGWSVVCDCVIFWSYSLVVRHDYMANPIKLTQIYSLLSCVNTRHSVIATCVKMFSLCCTLDSIQWRSQNADKVTHTKGKLLDHAKSLLNCVPFQNGNFS